MPTKTLGPREKYQGGIASGAPFPDPLLICLQIKENLFFPHSVLPQAFLGTGSMEGRSPILLPSAPKETMG